MACNHQWMNGGSYYGENNKDQTKYMKRKVTQKATYKYKGDEKYERKQTIPSGSDPGLVD